MGCCQCCRQNTSGTNESDLTKSLGLVNRENLRPMKQQNSLQPSFQLVVSDETFLEDFADQTIEEDMSKLGPPSQKDCSKSYHMDLFEYSYFRKMYKVISRHSKNQVRLMKKDKYADKRREAILYNQLEEYKSIVQNMIADEEKIESAVLSEACRSIDVKEEVFINSLQEYMQDPLVNTDLFKIGLHNSITQEILREFPPDRIKEIFIETEPERLKFLAQQSKLDDFSMESLTNVIVGKALLSDKIYQDWGIEEEELQASIVYYKLMEDPEILGAIRNRSGEHTKASSDE